MELKRLVTDLVDLGALGSGAFLLRLGPVKLRVLIEECVEGLRAEAAAKKLSLGSEIEIGTPSVVQADEARRKQVLLILIGNGIKFTKEGGVTVTAGRASSGSSNSAHTTHGPKCAGVCLELRVKDTGPGLSTADQRKILQLFSRMDDVPRGFGSGLSLVLAARLCVAMGGSLSVDSDGKHGTTFIVRLPLGLGVEVPAAEAAEFSPAMSGFNPSRCRQD